MNSHQKHLKTRVISASILLTAGGRGEDSAGNTSQAALRYRKMLLHPGIHVLPNPLQATRPRAWRRIFKQTLSNPESGSQARSSTSLLAPMVSISMKLATARLQEQLMKQPRMLAMLLKKTAKKPLTATATKQLLHLVKMALDKPRSYW